MRGERDDGLEKDKRGEDKRSHLHRWHFIVLAFPTWPEERTDKLLSAYRCRTPGEEVICLMAALKKQAVHIALYQTLMISFFPFDSISILSGRGRMMMASNQDVMCNKVSGRWSGRKQSQLSPHRVQAAVIVHILA